MALVAGAAQSTLITILKPAPAAATTARTGTPSTCRRQAEQVVGEFRPTSLSSRHVIGATRILARGRDAHGVPLPPPLTNTGKWEFAWDQKSHIGPGSRHGVVRLTAHTYPNFAGTALGNRLLARLRVGQVLVVSGTQGRQLCYRVTRRVSVRANKSQSAYYATGGAPRLAILVCSGRRRGPGDWTRRTIWFASPITQ
jgi:hypothetical protein